MTQAQSVNTFTELNTDTHPVNAPKNIMTDALNATLTTKGENQLILQNMAGNENVTQLSEGYQPLGVAVFKDIAYIVSGLFDTSGAFISGEIGTFPSPDWDALINGGIDPEVYLPLKQEYSPLRNFSNSTNTLVLSDDFNYTEAFSTDQFEFDSGRLIEVELQPSYDDSVNVIFTDDLNPVRLINSRFKMSSDGKSAAIADRRQTKDTNTYSVERFGATKLLRQADLVPDLTFLGLGFGGSFKGGGYRYYFKYMDSDGALTDIIEESRLVTMSYDDHGARDFEAIGKTVRFRFDDIDRKFSGIKVYYSYASGEVDVTTVIREINDIYDIPVAGPMDITIYGTETAVDITYDTLNINYSSIGTVKTISQFNDRLILGNVSSSTKDFLELAEAAQGLHIEEGDYKLDIKDMTGGYRDANNNYNYIGVWAGETYEVAIVYVLNKGRGTTVAFPTRGGDNYDGTFSYTGTAPITDPTGFVAGSTENRLGVYRTFKNRVMLEGVDSNYTRVRYLRINTTSLLSNPYVQAETEGFFFVRRERKKDALIQGYFTNTCEIPIAQAIPATGRLDINSPAIAYRAHVQDADRGIGVDSLGPTHYNYTFPTKIVPAPGRWWESIMTSKSPSNTSIFYYEGIPLSIQGKVFPNPNPTIPTKMRYAFYSPDALVNQPLVASLFNSSNKGVVLNSSSPIIGHYRLPAHTITQPTGSTTGDSFTYACEFILQNTVTHTSDSAAQDTAGSYIHDLGFSMHEPYLNAPMTIILTGFFDSLSNSEEFVGIVNIQIEVDPSGVITSGFVLGNVPPPPSGLVGATEIVGPGPGNTNPNLVIPSTITGTWDHPSGGTIGDSINGNTTFGSFNMVVTLPVYENGPGDLGGNTTQPNLKFTEIVNIIGTWNVTTFSRSSSNLIQVNPVGRSAIQNVEIDKFNFNPLTITDPTTVISATYVGENQEVYSGEQFAAKSDRNIFYTLRNGIDANGNQLPWTIAGPMTGGIAGGSILAEDQVKFSDYIGVEFSRPDPLLTLPLRNDTNQVYNTQANHINGNNVTGTDLGDWTYKVDDLGYRLAVTGNIYESPSGVLTQLNWINKYSNTSYIEPYFTITKRITWAQINQGLTPPVVDVFDGDCFIDFTYKRLNYSLGIEGVTTATDTTLYRDFNLQAGLYPRGTVIPLVCESNYNTALRTFDFKVATEKVFYGKDRSFYPIDSIKKTRESRQPESTGYNHGYSYVFSDRNYVALNDRAPVLNVNFGNRIYVSSSSVGGEFNNGYADLKGLNFKDYNKQLGQITKVISHNDNLFCIFVKGVGIVPMNQRTMVSEGNGGVFIDDAEVLADKMQIISTEYGSDQQFSIIKTDEAVYGCDLNQNKIWKIVQGGKSYKIELISDFAIQVILNEFKDRLKANDLTDVVKANYDRERNNVIFSFLSELDGTYSTDLYTEPDTLDPADPVDPIDPVVGDTTPPVSEDELAFRLGDLSELTSDGSTTPFPEVPGPLDPGDLVPEPLPEPIVPSPWTKDQIGSVYYNETVRKWISKLSWDPIFTFNLGNKLHSFNASADVDVIWEHFSSNVPYCNFYGNQDKFMFEFVLVDNASTQKVLNNLHIVSNRSFPGRIDYTIDAVVDYETFAVSGNSYTELLRQRHELVNLQVVQFLISGALYLDLSISQEESERLFGSYFEYNNNFYNIGNTVVQNGIVYTELLNQIKNSVIGLLPGLTIITRLEFGIIKQNMEYKEDHLYIEAGKDLDKSRIRDKAIKVKMIYEGMDYTTVQSIISQFVYSFN